MYLEVKTIKYIYMVNKKLFKNLKNLIIKHVQELISRKEIKNIKVYYSFGYKPRNDGKYEFIYIIHLFLFQVNKIKIKKN